MGDVIPCFSEFNIPFKSNASPDKTKRKDILHTIIKESNIYNISSNILLMNDKKRKRVSHYYSADYIAVNTWNMSEMFIVL